MSSSESALRPMNLGELLDRTFFLYRKHFLLFVGITALPQLLFLAVQMYDAVFGARPNINDPLASFNFIALTLQVVLLLFITAASQSATVTAVSRLYLGGQVSVSEAYGAIMRRILQVALMMIGIGFATFLCLVVCLIPGLILALMFGFGAASILALFFGFFPGVILMFFLTLMLCLAIPVAILERRGLFEATSRSAQLTKGWRLRILVIYILYIVLLFIFISVWQVPITVLGLMASNGDPAALPTWTLVASAVGTYVSSCLATPLFTVALSLVYYNQRVTKEAFDLQHMMSMLDDVAPASTS